MKGLDRGKEAERIMEKAKMERRKKKMISHLDSYIDVDRGWKIYE